MLSRCPPGVLTTDGCRNWGGEKRLNPGKDIQSFIRGVICAYLERGGGKGEKKFEALDFEYLSEAQASSGR